MPDPTGSPTDRRILLVKDEYLIATEMARWLAQAGYEVVGPVPSVEQAIDLAEEDDLAAAVLDINLGDGDRVYPAADRLAALGVPYLFTTGDVRVDDEPAYRDRPRLEKPILEHELIQGLERLLARGFSPQSSSSMSTLR